MDPEEGSLETLDPALAGQVLVAAEQAGRKNLVAGIWWRRGALGRGRRAPNEAGSLDLAGSAKRSRRKLEERGPLPRTKYTFRSEPSRGQPVNSRNAKLGAARHSSQG